MSRRTRLLVLFILITSITALCSWDKAYLQAVARNQDDFHEIQLVLDGVELSIVTPFLPKSIITLPQPGDPFQVANVVEREPRFRSLTITAIPYGLRTSGEIFPIAGPGKIVSYRNTLKAFRSEQGSDIYDGPKATLFGQEVQGMISTVDLFIDVNETRPVRIAEWVFEGGKRLWLLRLSEEMQPDENIQDPFSYENTKTEWSGIEISSPNLDASSLLSQDAVNLYEGPSIDLTTNQSELIFPPWWDGECDTNTYFVQTGEMAYPLGGSYRGLKACGPRPWADGAPHALVHFYPGSWGALEWECVELSLRFLYLAYQTPPYQANGNQIVTNYNGDRLIKIDNGTPGYAPQPNDVMSSGPETTWGHTFLVIDSNIDEEGNGSIDILEQNASASGLRTLNVVNWEVIGIYTVIGWLHDPTNGFGTVYLPFTH